MNVAVERRYWVTVKARRLDGAVTAADPVEAMHDRITYDVVALDTVDLLAVMQGLTPKNRPSHTAEIRAAAIGSDGVLLIGPSGSQRLYLFGESTEYDPCTQAGFFQRVTGAMRSIFG